MATFRQADDATVALVREIWDEQYPELKEAGVTVEVLFAHAARTKEGEPKGSALRHHGWPAAAIIKINSQKDRVAGCADCRLLLDGDRFPEMSDERQRAIIDHEGRHVEVKRDDDGNIQLDDCNRPKLKIREHDFCVQGFDDIITRHGHAALEAEAAIDLNRRLTQKEFSWG